MLALAACSAIVCWFAGAAGALELPKQLTTSTGNFITLEQYAKPTSKSLVASTEVQVCTSAHTPKGTAVVPQFFELTLAGGTTVHTASRASKSPGLVLTPLGPKQCVKGWLSFAVPAGAKVKALVYDYGKALSWNLG